MNHSYKSEIIITKEKKGNVVFFGYSISVKTNNKEVVQDLKPKYNSTVVAFSIAMATLDKILLTASL